MGPARATHAAIGAASVGGIALLGLSALASCQWVAGFAIAADSADGAAAATARRCDPLPAKKSASGGAMLLVKLERAVATGPCFWIDETEVPVLEYAAWLARDAGAWPAECAFKGAAGGASNPIADTTDSCAASVSPKERSPFDPGKPIRCVDWCDAQAYCLANGKRLCEGNPEFTGSQDRTRGDQWGYACSPSQMTLYPWGDVLDPWRCNVDQVNAGCSSINLPSSPCGPHATTAAAECRADGGPHDLVGNVAEWTSTCSSAAQGDAAPSTDGCQVRGGSFVSTPDRAQCASRDTATRDHRDPQTGFRCCADLTPEELALLPP